MKRRLALLSSFVATAALAAPTTAHAQREIGVGLNFDPRVPVGDLYRFVPDLGVAGVQGKWEWYAVDRVLAFGFNLEYHYFQHGTTPLTTVVLDNGSAVTAPFTRYAYFLTFLPTARYFPWASTLRVVRPYVELGAGATTATSAVLASDLSRRATEGGFVAQPSVGVLWAIESRSSTASDGAESEALPPRHDSEALFSLAASFAWAFTTADVVTAKNVSYVGVQVGVYAKP